MDVWYHLLLTPNWLGAGCEDYAAAAYLQLEHLSFQTLRVPKDHERSMGSTVGKALTTAHCWGWARIWRLPGIKATVSSFIAASFKHILRLYNHVIMFNHVPVVLTLFTSSKCFAEAWWMNSLRLLQTWPKKMANPLADFAVQNCQHNVNTISAESVRKW